MIVLKEHGNGDEDMMEEAYKVVMRENKKCRERGVRRRRREQWGQGKRRREEDDGVLCQLTELNYMD